MNHREAGYIGYLKIKHRFDAERQKKTEQARKIHEQQAKQCRQCNELIPYNKRKNVFCNHSCKATFLNKRRALSKVCALCENVAVIERKHCIDCIKTNKYNIFSRIKFDDLTTDSARRRRLLKEIGNKCNICENTVWRGQPIPVVLDHIDGNPTNNIRYNLRLICPNCDAQLPTYTGRNHGKGRWKRRQRYAENKSS